MKAEVSAAIEELKRQFPTATVSAQDDGQGGARVRIEPVTIGARYQPAQTWLGFHIPAQYPYADIYPFFISADVRRADGKTFAPPITGPHTLEGRQALQISRRNNTAQNAGQKVCAKVLKILDFLEKVA